MPSLLVIIEHHCHICAIDSWGRASYLATLNVGAREPTVGFDDSQHDFLCLRLEYNSMYIPTDTGPREYYRIADGRGDLVRAERGDGTFCPTWLLNSPPDRSEMQSLLESSDRVQQLCGLAAYFYGKLSSVKPINDTLRRRFTELAESPDPWISEEAKSALELAKEKKAAPRPRRGPRN
jgi:hypothetical protein